MYARKRLTRAHSCTVPPPPPPLLSSPQRRQEAMVAKQQQLAKEMAEKRERIRQRTMAAQQANEEV